MFKSKDGKAFGSRFAQRRRDAEHDADAAKQPKMSAAHEAGETPEFEAGEQEGAQESQNQNQPKQENPAEVVAKHGKAVHVHTSHDNVNGKHHVHTVHQDGHVHDSDHATEKEATDTAKQLGAGDEQAQETTDPFAQSAQDTDLESDGFKMPRLA